MLQGKLYTPETRRPFITIEYPERSKHAPETVQLYYAGQAEGVWRAHVRKYVLSTLLAFVKQRLRAIEAYKSSVDYANQYGHVVLLLEELPRHQHGRLEVMAGAVFYLTDSIRAIKPWDKSPFRRHYNEVIEPVIEWCDHFSKPHRRRAQR